MSEKDSEKTESEDLSLHDAIAQAVEADEAEAEEPVETQEAETEKDPEEVEEPAEETPEEPKEASEEGSEEESEEEAIDAPAHWALEDQEMFRALDGKVQNWLLGRSKDMEAAHTKRSQEIAPLRTAIERHKTYLDSINITPEMAFDTLITAEQTLRTGTEHQKRNALLKLAQDYGISLEEPKANGAAQEDFLTADIRKAVEPLQKEMGSLRQTLTERERAAQQAQANQLAETVQAFREQKTEAGELAHPYFEEVRDKMYELAQADTVAGRTSDLTKLYDDAIKLVPEVWAKLQAAQQHAAQLQEKRKQKEKVKKAKAANVSVTGESSAAPEQPKSLRATIEEAAAGSL